MKLDTFWNYIGTGSGVSWKYCKKYYNVTISSSFYLSISTFKTLVRPYKASIQFLHFSLSKQINGSLNRYRILLKYKSNAARLFLPFIPSSNFRNATYIYPVEIHASIWFLEIRTCRIISFVLCYRYRSSFSFHSDIAWFSMTNFSLFIICKVSPDCLMFRHSNVLFFG